MKSALFVIFLFLVTSCGKKMSYPFKFINNSNYNITQTTFSGVVSGESLSINQNDTTENIILSYETRFRVTHKLICLSVDDFVGSNNFSEVNTRSCTPFSKSDLNENINTIVITSAEVDSTITFNITLK